MERVRRKAVWTGHAAIRVRRLAVGGYTALALGFAAVTVFAQTPPAQAPPAQTPPAQTPPAQTPPAQTPPASTAPGPAASVPLPAGYVIGPDDQLSIVFWRDKDMSADVVVRPDGKISLPLLNDVQAAGLTPEELRAQLTKAASKYVADPNATVVVKEIRSRKVYITGNVSKPGTYPLTGDMTVLQLVALAGGLLEYADAKNIVVMRTEGGQQQSHKFNYKDVVRQKHVEQNILLKSGDTVVVP